MNHSILRPRWIVPGMLAFPMVLMVLGGDGRPKASGADGSTAQARHPPATEQSAADSTTEAGEARGDSDEPQRSKTGARPTSLSIIPVRGGVKTLTIHFRWPQYPQASIEVRLVPGANAKDTATVTPIYFAEHLKGKLREALFTCLDHSGEGGRSQTFTEEKTVYTMIGRRNSLGRQAVHVDVHPETHKTKGEHPSAAYLQLDTWAVNQETLSLDLDRVEFAKPGKLFVWFFRGERLVWDEQIPWEGYK